MRQLFSWIDSLINRLATNVTLWLVGAVVVLILAGFYAYSLVFIRLPQPPVYAYWVILEPQRPGGKYESAGPCAQPEYGSYPTAKAAASPAAQVARPSPASPGARAGASPAASPAASPVGP